ncbi:MAG: hypothetical protein Q9210_005042 [Variospora velana]
MPGSGLRDRPRTEAGAASDLNDDEDVTDDKGQVRQTKMAKLLKEGLRADTTPGAIGIIRTRRGHVL